MRVRLLTALLLCSSIFSYGQKPYYNQQENFLKANSVWAFGDSAGLDFNTNPPTAFKTAIYVSEGCASVADPVTGQLLFYSDGRKCWNRNNQVMPNGNGLLGDTIGTTTQGVCIVPVINSPNKYYLFSLNHEGHTPSLYYSIVDMNLDNGLGNIIATRKNILLDTSKLSESMIAIPGNNCDIWLLTHALQQPVFKAWHITRDGLDTMPVVSTAGVQMQGIFAYLVGSLAVSPDRTMVAITSFWSLPSMGGTLIAKFDASTGRVSEALYLTKVSCYGVCFSPDNSKLYVNTIDSQNLVQYEISNYDSAAIVSSASYINNSSYDFLSLLKLYNGKIYRSFFNKSYIGCINHPNLSGIACTYDTNFVSISSVVYGSLPNDVVYPLPPDTTHQLVLDTAVCSNQMLTLKGSSDYSGYLWDDGSTSQEREITTSGIYWVLNRDACHSSVDTFEVKVFALTPPVISVDSFTLRTVVSYVTYQWLLNENIIPGATQSTYTVTENGNYRVIVGNEHGCTDTSKIYKVTNVTGVTEIDQLANQIQIYPNPAKDMIYINAPVAVNTTLCSIEGKILKRIKKTNRVSLHDIAAGIYFLQVYDQKDRLIKMEKIIVTGR